MVTDAKKEEVRDSADIVEVVSDYVKLRRSGNGFMGLCPFHNEKTPSFHVSPRLGIYKCFGCGEAGDVFNFVMKMEGVGFNEAVRSLAERYGVFIPEEEVPEQDEAHLLREGIYHALRYAGLFYYRMLTESDEAEVARKYLEKRQLNQQTIKKYGLGYAPDSKDSLYRKALADGISEEYLHQGGLIKYGRNNQDVIDTFRGRLMFPIFNPSGKVIAFGGRILGNQKTAKYINSPQTPVYNKSEVLYGIQVARNEIRKEGEAILVEGYTDVLSMHQAGIRNVVSTSGTSLTAGQLHVIHRYGERLQMIYDADSAGQNAMVRGLDLALMEGLEVRLLQLPEDEDPDSFVRQFGGPALLEYIKSESRDFITFLVKKGEAAGDWDDPLRRKRAITDLVRHIAHVSDPIAQETYMQHLSNLTKIGDRVLHQELSTMLADIRREKQRERRRNERVKVNEDTPGQGKKEGTQDEEVRGTRADLSRKTESSKADEAPLNLEPKFEKEIIRLMIEYGRSMVEYIGRQCNEDHFENSYLKDFFLDIIDRYQAEEEISIEAYAAREHPYPAIVGEIVMDPHAPSERGQQKAGRLLVKDVDPFRTARGAMKALKIHFLDRLKTQLEGEYQRATPDEKQSINKSISQVGLERVNLERYSPDELFDTPDHTDPEES
ncbi:MAG TPA: DNA primase [Balneolales bacterium]|nr:DNA primase [Balneolales bacterium]